MTAQLPAPLLAAGTWTVSGDRTRIRFTVRSLGRPVHGTVACTRGELEADEGGRPARAGAEADLETLRTGIAKRDRDLRRPGLLDIDRQPVMAWSAERFRRLDDGRWAADGVLRVRGTAAALTVTGPAEVAPDGALRVRATGTLDRRTVGIRAPRILIGHVVEVEVDAVLVPAGGPSAARGGDHP